MRRLLVVLAVLSLHAVPAAMQAVQQERPLQADPVVRLLSDLERALGSGRIEDFRALSSPALPAADADSFSRAAAGTLPPAIVRERSRRPFATGIDVIVDVLTTRGRSGRIATWKLTVVPEAGTNDRFSLAGLTELTAVDGLVRLNLDTARQFAVRDLTLAAPDLKLTMASGSAFVAESEAGVTAIVLRGKGAVHFSPTDPAEQGQVQLFARRPALDTEIDSAFVRLNPAEFETLISRQSLVQEPADPKSVDRAQQIFQELSPRTYNLDLRALTQERWSLEPPLRSIVVEFRSRRYGWLTYARSPSEPEDITLFERSRTRNICVYASAETLRERGRFYSEDSDAAFDVLHYGVDLTFDPTRSWLSGRGSLRLRIRSAPATSLMFKLAQPLAVAAVTSPAFGDLLALRVVGQNNVLVSLPRLAPPGTEIDLDIEYNGRLSPQPLDREAIEVSGQTPGQLGQEAAEIVLMPEPRFMYSNRVFWYPQAPVTDYATASLRLSVPSEFQIVATGTLRGSSVAMAAGDNSTSRSMRTVEYRADRPVRYLSCVITRLVPMGRTAVEVPALAPADGAAAGSDRTLNLEVAATPRTTNRARALATRAASVLGFYATTIGEAPYPDFTLVAVDDNLPGGHSPAFFAMLHQPLPTTPYSWSSDPVAFDNVYPPFFLAHEIAHQWWGQAVGWKNYHEQWLSEGLAQYFAALYAESDRGRETFETLIADMRSSAEPQLKQGPISLGYRLGHIRGEGAVFRGIVYNKSAVVLHMLRRLMGDEAFFAGLRQFYRDWRFEKAGTDDFRATLEAHTRLRLGRFFDRWVLGSGIPRIRLTVRPGVSGAPGMVHVEQIGDVYDFPLSVDVEYADGQRETLSLAVTSQTVEQAVGRNVAVRRASVRDPLTMVAVVR